ncbi:hypothetical protein FGIG_01210 [Fasciola gigantica]|uniref:Uncharacterized protein n=1 Tax=Fasciola gigantica TaxID=46835 RepID=A0A504YD16_FASGI|nr:hypothetical protein FGIG_01210 [Fasciola gigantica]
MSSDAMLTYGPTPTELESLKATEKERRRRMRMMQVRQQARENAARTRELYELKKKRLVESVARELQQAYDRTALDELQNKQEQYRKILDDAGIGHQKAETWEDPQIEAERQACIDEQCAQKRGRIATQALRDLETDRRAQVEEPIARLRSVRESENERAALVAALPKPPNLDSLIELELPDPEPTVLVYNVAARNAVCSTRTPSTVAVKRSDAAGMAYVESEMPTNAIIAAEQESERLEALEHEQRLHLRENLIKADLRDPEPTVLVYNVAARNAVCSTRTPSTVAVKRSDAAGMAYVESEMPTNAIIAAEQESERLEALEHEQRLHLRENLIKADLRGQRAAKRERVRRHYQNLLTRLEGLSRADGARLRHQLASIGSIGAAACLTESLMNKRLEKAFENEILLQIANSVPHELDEVVPHQTLVTVGSVGESNSVDFVAEPAFETDVQTIQCSQPQNTSEIAGLGGESGGIAWTVSSDQNVSGPSSVSTSSFHRSIMQTNSEVPAPSITKQAPTAPNSIVSLPKDRVAGEQMAVVSTEESILGPGERPELPSIHPRQRRYHAARGDHGGAAASITSDAVSLKDPTYDALRSLNTLPGRAEHTPPTFLNLSSARTLTDSHGSVALSARSSQGTSLSEQQELLNLELAEIDQRIARIRMGTIRKRYSAENSPSTLAGTMQTDTVPTGPEVSRPTPRDSVVVEGRAVSERSDKSSIQKESPQTDKSDSSTVREPLKSELYLSNIPSPSSNAGASGNESGRTMTSIPDKWRQKLTSIISSQIKEFHSHRDSRRSPASLSVGHSDASLSDRSKMESLTSPREGGDTPSQLEKSENIPPRSEPIALDKPLPAYLLDSEVVNQSSNQSESIAEAIEKAPFVEDITRPESEIASKRNSSVSSVEMDPTLRLRDSPSVPLLSLGRLNNEECSVFQHINKLAHRLAQTTLEEATAELAADEFRSSSHSESDQSKQRFIPVGIKLLQSGGAFSSSESQSTKTTITTKTDNLSEEIGSSTVRSLKAELRNLLTSSLISSLLSGSGVTNAVQSSSLTGGLSSTREAIRQLSPNSGHNSLSVSSKQSDTISGSLESKTSPNSNHGVLSESIASLSDVDGSYVDGVATVVPVRGTAEHSFVDLAVTKDDMRPCEITIPSEAQSQEREQPSIVKVNKSWLFNLLGKERSKIFHTEVPRKLDPHQPLESYGDSSHNSLHPLSPIDSSFVNLSVGHRCGSRSPSTISGLSSASASSPFSSSSSTTVGTHPSSFRPLPRLDEAPSEESIADQSVPYAPPIALTLAEGESLQTPSTSWTDSRKSNDFHALSRCSTSNSNLAVTSDLLRNSPTHKATEDIVDTTEDDQTTLHRLRSDMPITPVEPYEALVVPCLGSNGSASAPTLDSSSASVSSSPIPLQSIGAHDTSLVLREPSAHPPSSAHLASPPVLANETRNTTTIDSSIVWDDLGEMAISTDQNTSMDCLGFYGTFGGLVPQPTPRINITSINKDEHDRVQVDRVRTPRPMCPADGAAARPSPHRPFANSRETNLAPFASMPVIYVDCDVSGPSIKHLTPRSVCGALYASWGSFNLEPLPPADAPSPLSDSLRSFQQHEANFLMMEREIEQQKGPPRNRRPPPARNNFLNQPPSCVTAADVRQNAVAIRSVAHNSDDHKRSLANRTGFGKNDEGRRVWGAHVPNRSVDASRGRTLRRAAPAVTSPGHRQLHPNRGATRSRTPDPLELAMSNVAVDEVRYIQYSSPPKRKSGRQTTLSRSIKTRSSVIGSKLHASSGRTIHGHNQLREARNPGNSKPVKKDNATSHSATAVAVPPNCTVVPNLSSFIHSSSISVEQSLRNQLRNWRAVRLGNRIAPKLSSSLQPVVPSNVSRNSPHEAVANSAGGNGSLPPTECANFASVQSEAQPLMIERTADEDISATTLWMNEIAFQPPSTLSGRPSSPTPNIAGRTRTSSDFVPIEEENVETEVGSTVPYQRTEGLNRQSNLFPMAFTVDFDAAVLSNTACAGDELSEKRIPINELHFSSLSPFRRIPVTTDEMDGVPLPNTSLVLQVPTCSSEPDGREARTVPTGQPVSATAAGNVQTARVKAPTTVASRVTHLKHRETPIPDQKQREEQARLNRQRVKEFDRLRRERLFRRKKRPV